MGISTTAGGDLWITFFDSGTLASVTTAGVATARPVVGLAKKSGPSGVTQTKDGRIWFTERFADAISSVTSSGEDYRQVRLPAGTAPSALALGPDGNLWFTGDDLIGRLTPSGGLTQFALPAGSAPTSIAASSRDWLAFTMFGKDAIGRITTSGKITTTALPSSNSEPFSAAVDKNGAVWFTEFGIGRIGRLMEDGSLAEFLPPSAGTKPVRIAAGPDGAMWFTQDTTARIGRITSSGQVTEYPLGAEGYGLTAGADGNMWVTDVMNRISRVLTGVVPVSTGVPTITGTSTTPGSVLTAAPGSWTFSPTSYGYQWQRCTSADPSSCADIPGATATTRTIDAADAGTWLRVVATATNTNGPSTATGSALLQMGAKPIPAPVTGGASVTIAPGVTASFRAVNTTRRKVLRSYRVTVNSGAVRGKVRMSLVNSAGTEVLVIAKARWIRSAGPTGVAKRWKRIPRSVPRGTYTLRAVFTPHPAAASDFAVATMSRSLRVR